MSLLLPSVCAAIVLAGLYKLFKPKPLRDINGPPSPSWLLGNELEIRYQTEVGDLDFKWNQEYGDIWRVKGCYGEEILYVADPKALQYIFHTSGYNFPKKKDVALNNEFLLGRGIATAEGHAHQRHRKVMNPAFSAAQLRSFLPVFRQAGFRLTQKWKDELQGAPDGKKNLNIARWLARATLDVIGEAAFDYRFGSLDDADNKLLRSLDGLFADSLLHPPAWDLLFKALWRYIPYHIARFFAYIPTREYSKFRRFLTLAKSIARNLVNDKASGLSDKGNKDILNVLVQSNRNADPKRQLDEDEMLSEMATLMLAGHETTAQSLSWLLFELAKHPEDQRKVREEVAAARAKFEARGDDDFAIADLDGMEFANAAIKEALRLHPIGPQLFRQAGHDDVLPLSTPIVTRSGKVITEIPIRKGQNIVTSISCYNRLKSVWGEDADEWNPMRFMEGNQERGTSVGVFANLLTFSAGIRACIGWRFSVIEIQALLAELLENFEVKPPSDKSEVQRIFATAMIPMVKGRMEEGVQLPLEVSAI